MGPFPWLHLPMPVRPASTTITLLPHTPLIIIGAADVAFNRLLLFLSGLHMPRYELRALDFVSLSLPALHNLIVHHHPASCTLTYKLRSAFFGTRSNHPPRMSFFLHNIK
jgi:hypothetical protein